MNILTLELELCADIRSRNIISWWATTNYFMSQITSEVFGQWKQYRFLSLSRDSGKAWLCVLRIPIFLHHIRKRKIKKIPLEKLLCLTTVNQKNINSNSPHKSIIIMLICFSLFVVFVFVKDVTVTCLQVLGSLYFEHMGMSKWGSTEKIYEKSRPK